VGVELTWWGHSTVSLTVDAVHLVTDPLLTPRVVHLTRRSGPVPPPLQPDVVLVSHLHHDHCHLPSLRRLPAGTVVVVPMGAAGLLRSLPVDVREAAPDDEVAIGDVTVRAVRAVHDGRRHPGSRWWAPALGYVVSGSRTVWFAGDTGPAPMLGADVGAVDVALVPVGGWGPVSRRSVDGQHLGPADAASVVDRVGARCAVPIHYGTLWPQGLKAHDHPSFASPGAQFGELCPVARVPTVGEALSCG
jgi:L-ascorbate metabolism protein UlaG (beta-lactamase superfamily)